MRPAIFAAALLASTTTASAQPSPEMQSCASPDCSAARRQIGPQATEARRGDYQAMRNVAFCMWDGCDGAVKVDRKASCEWRRRIIKLKQADRNDELSLSRCLMGGY